MDYSAKKVSTNELEDVDEFSDQDNSDIGIINNIVQVNVLARLIIQGSQHQENQNILQNFGVRSLKEVENNEHVNFDLVQSDFNKRTLSIRNYSEKGAPLHSSSDVNSFGPPDMGQIISQRQSQGPMFYNQSTQECNCLEKMRLKVESELDILRGEFKRKEQELFGPMINKYSTLEIKMEAFNSQLINKNREYEQALYLQEQTIEVILNTLQSMSQQIQKLEGAQVHEINSQHESLLEQLQQIQSQFGSQVHRNSEQSISSNQQEANKSDMEYFRQQNFQKLDQSQQVLGKVERGRSSEKRSFNIIKPGNSNISSQSYKSFRNSNNLTSNTKQKQSEHRSQFEELKDFQPPNEQPSGMISYREDSENSINSLQTTRNLQDQMSAMKNNIANHLSHEKAPKLMNEVNSTSIKKPSLEVSHLYQHLKNFQEIEEQTAQFKHKADNSMQFFNYQPNQSNFFNNIEQELLRDIEYTGNTEILHQSPFQMKNQNQVPEKLENNQVKRYFSPVTNYTQSQLQSQMDFAPYSFRNQQNSQAIQRSHYKNQNQMNSEVFNPVFSQNQSIEKSLLIGDPDRKPSVRSQIPAQKQKDQSFTNISRASKRTKHINKSPGKRTMNQYPKQITKKEKEAIQQRQQKTQEELKKVMNSISQTSQVLFNSTQRKNISQLLNKN